MPTAYEILVKARALIAKPGGWTREHFARNKSGDPVEIDAPNASCFCTIGAVKRANILLGGGRDLRAGEGYLARSALAEAIVKTNGDIGIIEFNDLRARHADVLAVFDEAIVATKE